MYDCDSSRKYQTEFDALCHKSESLKMCKDKWKFYIGNLTKILGFPKRKYKKNFEKLTKIREFVSKVKENGERIYTKATQ